MKLDAAQTVTLFLAKMGDRDLDGALALCAEDIVLENPAMDPPANVAIGRDIIRERHTRLFERVVAVSWPIQHIVSQGNLVMTERIDKSWLHLAPFPAAITKAASSCRSGMSRMDSSNGGATSTICLPL